MAEDRVGRRLAAIMMADVVGYSRMMEADEAGTLLALKARRNDLVEPVVRTHNGRIVKGMGDGFLVEFASAVNAVGAAFDLQARMAEANQELPGSRRIVLRIGINLGDVIEDGTDIYGEGVNIAARIEALAEPGGIFVSDSIRGQVKGKLDCDFNDLGLRQVKNLSEPIHVYQAIARQPAGSRVAAQPEVTGERTSIAVLPFDNMSGDAEQSYFSDGITEDIITELSKFRELKVIARNSSFQFRGQSIDIRTVSQRLGVTFVVEGGVRKMGNRIRVTAQLIQASTASHVWAERYERELTDVFAIQDEISRAVASRVAGISLSVLAGLVRARPTNSLSAYDCFLRGRELFNNYDTGLDCAPFLEKAIELDPGFAIPHALLSDICCFRQGFDGQRHHLVDALEFARKALSLDSNEPWANYAMALTLTRMGKLSEAGYFHERANSLNPNDAYMMAVYADWLSMAGRDEKAIATMDDALSLDPYAYDWFWDARAKILTVAGRYRDSIDFFCRLKSATGIPARSYCYQAISHIELGETSNARAALERCHSASAGRSPESVFAAEAFANPATATRLMASLRKAILQS